MTEQQMKRLDITWKALAIFVTIAIASTGYTLTQVSKCYEMLHNVDIRLARIEANRFTSADANKMLTAIVQLEKKIPNSIPPAWWKSQVEKEFLAHDRRLDKLEKALADHHKKG